MVSQLELSVVQYWLGCTAFASKPFRTKTKMSDAPYITSSSCKITLESVDDRCVKKKFLHCTPATLFHGCQVLKKGSESTLQVCYCDTECARNGRPMPREKSIISWNRGDIPCYQDSMQFLPQFIHKHQNSQHQPVACICRRTFCR